MSVMTSTLASRMKSSAAARTMPRWPDAGCRGGEANDMEGSCLEGARLDRGPDAVHERWPAGAGHAREHDGAHLDHLQHVRGVARPGSVLELVANAEAVHVVGRDLRGLH